MGLRAIAPGRQWYPNEHKAVDGLNCQNVSGSSSRRQFTSNPGLWDETVHVARCPTSGKLVLRVRGPIDTGCTSGIIIYSSFGDASRLVTLLAPGNQSTLY